MAPSSTTSPSREKSNCTTAISSKIGPLTFEVRIEATAPVNRPTPPPPTKPVTKTVPASQAKTPLPATAAKPATDGTPAPTSEVPAEKSEGTGSHDDDIAAMLLSLHDDGTPGSSGSGSEVPEGSTVHEMPLPPELAAQAAEKEREEKAKAAKAATGNTSSAAKSILEKYMRRPRT